MHATKSAQTLVQRMANLLGVSADASILTKLVHDVAQFEQRTATATREACNTKVAELEARLQQFEELVDALMCGGAAPEPAAVPVPCPHCRAAHRP